jgi:prepilin peptidase CpaA
MNSASDINMHAITVPIFATLLGASAWAVREDVLFHRISNRLTVSVLCAGLTLQLALAGWEALGQAALGMIVGLTVLLPLYLLRATGAGDVKLLAALGTLLGPQWTFIGGLYTLIAGGALALGYVAYGAVTAAITPAGIPCLLRIQYAFERAQQLRRERFPYALAIGLGAIGAAIQRGDLKVVIDYLTGATA